MKRAVFFLQNELPLTENHKKLLLMAKFLGENSNTEVFFVNKASCKTEIDGFSEKVKFVSTEEFNPKDFAQTVFYTPINFIAHLLTMIAGISDAIICPVSFCAAELDWLANNIGSNEIKPWLKEKIYNEGACVFGDASCVSQYDGDYSNLFFAPVVDNDIIENKEYGPVSEDAIRVAYVGDFNQVGCNILNMLISDYLASGLKQKLALSVVGTAKCWLINRFGSAFSGNISVTYTGKLSDEETVRYLKESADAVMAYDANALKAVKFGLPVIIAPLLKNEYGNYDYSWLYEASVGVFRRTPATKSAWRNAGKKFSEIIKELTENGAKKKLAEKCMTYFKLNTSPLYIAEKLIEAAQRSSLTANKLFENSTVQERISEYLKYKNCGNGDYNAFLRDNSKPVQQKSSSSNTAEITKHKGFIKLQKGFAKKVQAVRKLYKKQGKIDVGFIVLFKSVFNMRPIFEKMLGSKQFNPYIIVVPYVLGTMKTQMDMYNDTLNSLTADFGDRVIGGYDEVTDSYYDLREKFPILFFHNPYGCEVHALHHITNFLDKNVLTLYSSYGFSALKFWEEVVKEDFYNQVWKICVENEATLERMQEIQVIKGINGVVTGYVKMDKLANVIPTERERKRILICPHHTVVGWSRLDISNFLRYAEFFTELPRIFPEVDFVFRPHPLLIKNLLEHKIWTQKQIDAYFEKLLSNLNMTYDTSADYMQVFADSDAMIHDCGSFIAEYLYTAKPCMYMMKDKKTTYEGLVPFGQKCMEQYYHAFCEEDITRFIKEVVIDGNDPMKEQRERFAKNELMVNFPHAADSVINMIKKELGIK